MGMSSDVEIRVRAFNEEAKKKVLAIDLGEYNLIDWTESNLLLEVYDSDLAAGRNDFMELMKKVAEVLDK